MGSPYSKSESVTEGLTGVVLLVLRRDEFVFNFPHSRG